jgi:hypothetical protein
MSTWYLVISCKGERIRLRYKIIFIDPVWCRYIVVEA